KILRDQTNAAFDKMKEHRKVLDEKFRDESAQLAENISDELAEIEKKIEKGLGLKPLFEDLKDLQRRFKDTKLIRKHRNKLRKQIDKAFKVIKAKRFGENANRSDNKLGRLQRRYDGLVKAISKMKSSIGRDKKDVEFEERRISSTDGQLEAQIRTAKLKMIRERIDSKQEKLDEMLKIEKTLEEQIAREKEKEEKAKKMSEAKEKTKDEIAGKIEQQKTELAKEADKLKKQAEKITTVKKSKKSKSKSNGDDNLVSAVNSTLGESLEDVVDTIKAIAEVVSDQLSDLGEEE
ncbi:MAG: hypothetical protein R3275_11530, partial [Saprospiraceae bacterium]|nr:hypothetical protein [Saprospiraceae bacterium]